MNQSNLDKLLIQSNEGINNAVKTVANFQKGKINPIQTSYWFLNMICLGGLLPDLIISILGRPGHGKSFIAHILRNDILADKARNVGVLLYNWEMSWFALLYQSS